MYDGELVVKMPRDHVNYLFGDSHRGLKARADDPYFDLIKEIRRGTEKQRQAKGAYHLGDLVEGSPSNHQYYDVTNMDSDTPLPIQQYDKAFNELLPIIKTGQLKNINKGNHDKRIGKTFGNLLEDKCKQYGVNYGTWTTVVVVKDFDGNFMYRMFLTHGFGSIRNSPSSHMQEKANRSRRLRDMLKRKHYNCHVMICGHSHKLFVVEPHYHGYLFSRDGKLKQGKHRPLIGDVDYIHEDHRWYVNTGSFLKTYEQGIDTYSEEAGYDPVDIGYAKMIVKDGTIKDIKTVEVTDD